MQVFFFSGWIVWGLYDQAPRPSPGPHKLRESLPLSVFLRNRLKYALTGREVTSIVKQRLIKIDGKVRTDNTYPAGFMGVFTYYFIAWWKSILIISLRCHHYRKIWRALPTPLRCQRSFHHPPYHSWRSHLQAPKSPPSSYWLWLRSPHRHPWWTHNSLSWSCY